MATTMRIFATAGALCLLYLAVSIFFFIFSSDNPYSDGDMFLRGIIDAHWLVRFIGGFLIGFSISYYIFNKKDVKERLRNLFSKIFAGK
jgi:hypothetical protein